MKEENVSSALYCYFCKYKIKKVKLPLNCLQYTDTGPQGKTMPWMRKYKRIFNTAFCPKIFLWDFDVFIPT